MGYFLLTILKSYRARFITSKRIRRADLTLLTNEWAGRSRPNTQTQADHWLCQAPDSITPPGSSPLILIHDYSHKSCSFHHSASPASIVQASVKVERSEALTCLVLHFTAVVDCAFYARFIRISGTTQNDSQRPPHGSTLG